MKNLSAIEFLTDKASGAKTDGLGVEEVLNFVRSGDTLCVRRHDRLVAR